MRLLHAPLLATLKSHAQAAVKPMSCITCCVKAALMPQLSIKYLAMLVILQADVLVFRRQQPA